MGGYRRAILNGKDVAGAMPLMQEGQPPAWSTYVSVDDIEAIGGAVQENDGTMPLSVARPGWGLLYGTAQQRATFGRRCPGHNGKARSRIFSSGAIQSDAPSAP